jgi:hypothetical protein
LANGDADRRTTCTDEIFVTARTVCAATRVKSGPFVGAAAAACSGS